MWQEEHGSKYREKRDRRELRLRRELSHRYITAAALPDGVEQELAGAILVEHADADTQNIGFFDLGHFDS